MEAGVALEVVLGVVWEVASDYACVSVNPLRDGRGVPMLGSSPSGTGPLMCSSTAS